MKLAAIVSLFVFCSHVKAQQIEVSPHRKPHTRDATVGYQLTPAEAKFQASKPDSDVGGDSGFNAKRPGSLIGKHGKLIAWFGIVRELPDKEEGPFLIEHKHFDGLNDFHMQLASIYGVGDFKIAASDPQKALTRLSLVRVIGTVISEDSGVPVVKADYIRVWQPGDFAFMDYGADASSERWKKLREKVDFFYSSEPDAAYYEKILGK